MFKNKKAMSILILATLIFSIAIPMVFVTIASASQITNIPFLADASVGNATGKLDTTSPDGTDRLLLASTTKVSPSSGAGSTRNSFVKFSTVSALNSSDIVNAKLYLKILTTGNIVAGSPAPVISIFKTDTTWDESTITWNNQGTQAPVSPATAQVNYSLPTTSSKTAIEAGNWLAIDITNYLKANSGDITHSLQLKINTAVMQFYSKDYLADATFQPYIKLETDIKAPVTINYINATDGSTIKTADTSSQSVGGTYAPTITQAFVNNGQIYSYTAEGSTPSVTVGADGSNAVTLKYNPVTISSYTTPSVTVAYNSSQIYDLPSTLDVVLSDSVTTSLPMTWSRPTTPYSTFGETFVVNGVITGTETAITANGTVGDRLITTDTAYTESSAASTNVTKSNPDTGTMMVALIGDGSASTRNGLIRFNLGDINVNGLTSVKIALRLTGISGTAGVTYQTVNVFEEGYDWSSSTVTQALLATNSIKGNKVATGVYALANKNTWVYLDITDYIKANPTKKSLNFILEGASDARNTKTGSLVQFATKANIDYAPYLDLTFSVDKVSATDITATKNATTGKIDVSFTATNCTDTTSTPKLIAVAYDGTHKVLGIKTIDVSIPSAKRFSTNIETSIDAPYTGAYQLSLFMWKDFESLLPSSKIINLSVTE